MPSLEEMGSFFNARAASYEEHMLTEVAGAARFYQQTARLLPLRPGLNLLDLGCGSGLELDQVFALCPTVQVTGIDLSQGLMDILRRKHGDKALQLIHGSYFDVDLGQSVYDAAVSVESLHHFPPEQKLMLYQRILDSLKPGGVYVETDYTARDQVQQDAWFAEAARLKQGLPEGFYHFDTPLTAENQLALLHQAGFARVELSWREQATCIFVANKA